MPTVKRYVHSPYKINKCYLIRPACLNFIQLNLEIDYDTLMKRTALLSLRGSTRHIPAKRYSLTRVIINFLVIPVFGSLGYMTLSYAPLRDSKWCHRYRRIDGAHKMKIEMDGVGWFCWLRGHHAQHANDRAFHGCLLARMVDVSMLLWEVISLYVSADEITKWLLGEWLGGMLRLLKRRKWSPKWNCWWSGVWVRVRLSEQWFRPARQVGRFCWEEGAITTWYQQEEIN